MTTKQTKNKTSRARQNAQTSPKPRKPRKSKPVVKETLEDISFLAPEPVRKKTRQKAPVAKEREVKGKVPAKRVPFKQNDLPVLSQKKPSVAVLKDDFQPKNFEAYCLHHWGKINLYFLLPASISPPLLGLWLTPAGMTAGFAILVFISVWGIANLLSFLLVLLIWALKGER